MKKVYKIILSIVIIIAIGAVVLFFLLNKKEKIEEVDAPRVRVAGVVIDLLHTPVSGVDLVVGDTSIRTGETGRFIFVNVSVKTGIRLTHPELLRAIVKLPETLEDIQTTSILFDIPLYNSLITIIDAEARGGADKAYGYLAQEIKQALSRQAFSSAYEPLFAEEDITNQEIIIKRIRRETNYYARDFDHRFKVMVEFEVMNDSRTKWYRLVLSDNEKWRLMP